jgi:hypothetical protein
VRSTTIERFLGARPPKKYAPQPPNSVGSIYDTPGVELSLQILPERFGRRLAGGYFQISETIFSAQKTSCLKARHSNAEPASIKDA